MGLFSGIKKAVKKVFKGVGKVFDKIVPDSFKKILSNKWVGYAMTAVAVVSGGIAIANGITQGVGAFQGAAAQATLTDKLGAAAVEFGKGFMSGLSDPVGTAKGWMSGADTAAKTAQGVAGSVDAGSKAAADKVAGSTAKDAAQKQVSNEAAMESAKQAANAQVIPAEEAAKATMKKSVDKALGTGASASPVKAAAGSAGQNPGLLKSIGSKAWDWASSPAGTQVLGQTANNYFGAKAELEAASEERARQQEMWRRFIQEREANYRPTGVPNNFQAAAQRLNARAGAAHDRNAQRTAMYGG